MKKNSTQLPNLVPYLFILLTSAGWTMDIMINLYLQHFLFIDVHIIDKSQEDKI